MPAFWLCVGLGVVVIWFATSSHFSSIGKFIRDLWENATDDDENINKEKENENE